MFAQPRKAYLLLNVEPEFDCANPVAARAALDGAEFVVVLSPFRHGMEYADAILPVGPFTETAAGELVGWSRILDDEEALCILITNPRERRGADIQVDRSLSGGRPMRVIYNSAESADAGYNGPYRVGDVVVVNEGGYVSIREVGASEVIILGNHP
jgi:hypothetical protein